MVAFETRYHGISLILDSLIFGSTFKPRRSLSECFKLGSDSLKPVVNSFCGISLWFYEFSGLESQWNKFSGIEFAIY